MTPFIILAAGKGTRMKTEKPKALVEAKGKPLLQYVLETVSRVSDELPHVIVGHKAQDVLNLYSSRIYPVEQTEQKGTGHAVMSARETLLPLSEKHTHIIVMFADQPLVSADSLRKLIQTREETGAVFSMATVAPEHHEGDFAVFERMGRIVRDENGSIQSIVEYKDASDEIRSLKEVNSSVYCFDPKWLWEHLDLIKNANASGEYYLTDLVAIAREKGKLVVPVILPTVEGMGANTPEELAVIERYL